MADPTVHGMAQEPIKKAKDGKTRKLFWGFIVLWLVLVTFLISWLAIAYISQRDQTLSFAEEIQKQCDQENLSGGLCGDAEKVVKNDGEVQTIIGAQGPKGDKGDTGTQGPKGDTGSPGPKGDKGDTGQNGSEGAAGTPGSVGSQGPQGIPGEQGEPGATGPQGEPGPMGPQGEQGPSGLVSIQTVGCDGPVISSITSSYDAESRTITISCNVDQGAGQ